MILTRSAGARLTGRIVKSSHSGTRLGIPHTGRLGLHEAGLAKDAAKRSVDLDLSFRRGSARSRPDGLGDGCSSTAVSCPPLRPLSALPV